MVRLKGVGVLLAKVIANTFQFLMVRLKVEIHHQPYIHKLHFNSLWCD